MIVYLMDQCSTY